MKFQKTQIQKHLKKEFKQYRYAWPLLYVFIYMPWFVLLEKYYTADYAGLHIIHCVLDDMIPFNELFIIPYLLWFFYIPAVFVFLFYHSKNEFYRLCAFEFSGMTIALFICTIYPNGLHLRMEEIHRQNIFVHMTQFIYTNDTPTNVFPSIHVFATLAAHLCLIKSPHMKNSNPRKYLKFISGCLAVLICMSTVFLKQHSIIDLIGGILLAIILYFVVFYLWFQNVDFPAPNDRDPKKHQVLFFLNRKQK